MDNVMIFGVGGGIILAALALLLFARRKAGDSYLGPQPGSAKVVVGAAASVPSATLVQVSTLRAAAPAPTLETAPEPDTATDLVSYGEVLREEDFERAFALFIHLPAEENPNFIKARDIEALRHLLTRATTSAEVVVLFEYIDEGSDEEFELVKRELELATVVREAMDVAEEFGHDSEYGRLALLRAAELIKSNALHDYEEETDDESG